MSLVGTSDYYFFRDFFTTVYVSNTTDREDGSSCIYDYGYNEGAYHPNKTLICKCLGRYVIFYSGNRAKNNILDLCEVEVFGTYRNFTICLYIDMNNDLFCINSQVIMSIQFVFERKKATKKKFYFFPEALYSNYISKANCLILRKLFFVYCF